MQGYNFEKLDCWQNAKNVAFSVYKLCQNYPSKEQFALTNQTTRAAVSIVANIAEGSSRASKKGFKHFLEISLGSAFELETLLIIALENKYLAIDEKDKISNIIKITIKQIYGLKRSLDE